MKYAVPPPGRTGWESQLEVCLTCSVTFQPNWLLSDRNMTRLAECVVGRLISERTSFWFSSFSQFFLSSLVYAIHLLLRAHPPPPHFVFGVCASSTHAWNGAPGQTSVAQCPWSDLWLEASGSWRVAVASPDTEGDNLRALSLSLVFMFLCLIKIHTAAHCHAHARVLSCLLSLCGASAIWTVVAISHTGLAVSHLFLIKRS